MLACASTLGGCGFGYGFARGYEQAIEEKECVAKQKKRGDSDRDAYEYCTAPVSSGPTTYSTSTIIMPIGSGMYWAVTD